MYPRKERPNYGVFIRSQIESLSRHGVASEVVQIPGDGSKLNYLWALAMLPGRARARPYDLLHIHFGYTALAAIGIRHLPSVLSFCGSDLLGQPDEAGRSSRYSLALARLSKYAARRSQAVIVKSDEMARALGPGYADVAVIPNGIDLELFQPLPRQQARAALGWPQDEAILLFPADRREPRKNFSLAKAVHERLLSGGRTIRLESLYGRPQSDIVLAMAAADVMLSCSSQEGSPNVVKEAMAMNLPIVATNVGDCAERLMGVRSCAVPPTDLDAFVAATAAILDAGNRSNGRDYVQQLSLDAIARRILVVYRRAIARFIASGAA
ncbi:glycosyltransferase [uncultured Thiodictyon sp.]|uniref:glycosyltransferase n=1 Tax=uncultured Thiodictyon sp. TaxID=1846217 RepID=UPI0025E556E2|nr:glycosyltransferase [uncultured Thiodictyon sp.]